MRDCVQLLQQRCIQNMLLYPPDSLTPGVGSSQIMYHNDDATETLDAQQVAIGTASSDWQSKESSLCQHWRTRKDMGDWS